MVVLSFILAWWLLIFGEEKAKLKANVFQILSCS